MFNVKSEWPASMQAHTISFGRDLSMMNHLETLQTTDSLVYKGPVRLPYDGFLCCKHSIWYDVRMTGIGALCTGTASGQDTNELLSERLEESSLDVLALCANPVAMSRSNAVFLRDPWSPAVQPPPQSTAKASRLDGCTHCSLTGCHETLITSTSVSDGKGCCDANEEYLKTRVMIDQTPSQSFTRER